jgi:methanesulfonate monooxygenase subunit alpha
LKGPPMPSRTAAQWLDNPTVPDSHYVSGLVYSDDGIFAEERAKIFGKVWSFVCHESELPEPFDFRTVDYAGTPLVMVRGQDRRIRTFVNVCSHRGAKLVNQPSGNAKTFVCFYHYWSYDTAGACINIPRPEAYQGTGLDQSKCGLREVKTEVRLGLVFINLDDHCGSVDDFIGGGLDPFRACMGDTELQVFHFQRTVIRANWKAWMETNMDSYHAVMHVVLRKTQVDAARRITVHGNGHVSTGGVKAEYSKYQGWGDRHGSMALPGLDPDELRVGNIFPNSTIITRGTVMRIDLVLPISPHEVAVESRGLGVKGDTEAARLARIRHHNQYWGPFSRNWPEDAFAAEACEKTFATGAARHQIIAREENARGQDDETMRVFYAEWSRRMGRPAHNPANRDAGTPTP